MIKKLLHLLRSSKEDRKRVVLITGASTGLGLALTKELVLTEKFHAIATARRFSLQRFMDAEVVESERRSGRLLHMIADQIATFTDQKIS